MSSVVSLRTPFSNILRNMIRYAYLLANTADDQDNQVADIGFYGSKVRSRVIWPYGLSGLAPRGSTMFNFIVNAQAQNNACIPTYPQERRKNMKEWEFATGNFKTKAETYYDDDGNLNILAPQGNVNIITPNDVTINCANLNIICKNLNVQSSTQFSIVSPSILLNGDVDANGALNNNGVAVGSTHDHNYVKPLHPDGTATTTEPN